VNELINENLQLHVLNFSYEVVYLVQFVVAFYNLLGSRVNELNIFDIACPLQPME